MRGEIIKIEKYKSEKHGYDYYLVLFRLENGKTAITYLVPEHKNFRRWKKFLKVGMILQGLRFKNGLIDADSLVEKYLTTEDLAKLGVF